MKVVNGEGPSPRLVLAQFEALPPGSLTNALRLGGRQFLGWDEGRALMAGIFDSINANTVATAHWGKGQRPQPPTWKRPKAAPITNVQNKTSVKDLYARFNRRK